MSTIKLTIPIRIVPKAKPRFRRYDKPQPDGRVGLGRSHEEEIGLLAADQMRRKGYRIIEEDVILSANIFYRGKVPGDLDHIVATLLDGIKGVVMRDDKLVKGFERVFAIPNFGQDCVVIELRPIKDLTK